MEHIFDALSNYIGEAIVATIGAIVTFVTSRSTRKKAAVELNAAIREKDAELESLRISNSSSIIEQYQKAMKDLNELYESKHQHLVNDYKNRLEDIKADYDRRYENLKKDNEDALSSMRRSVDRLKRQVDSWRTKYNSLKSEFEEYRKAHNT